ncbi:esterase/lipase family protein [Nocardia crassostreae]|uniref:esterase/lipase family protein n=1 Tax=Nocardia crassostreae TaxID=53428 RepID=UPI001FDFAC47|nr:alpha/beta fold hydrolase [Nocardia crassostreae]
MGIGRTRWAALRRRIASVGVIVTGVMVGAVIAPIETGFATAEPAGSVVIPVQGGPQQTDHLTAARYLKTHPNAAPQGVNDFECKPSAEHPRPVVLAHGTDSSAYSDYSVIGAQLVREGFCVFAPNYGGEVNAKSYGTEDVFQSSAQIGAFTEQVLAATGAAQVDMVGFSQGASVTRYWINQLGGAPKVNQWVGIASPSYGGVMYGLVTVADTVPIVYDLVALGSSQAAVQQAAGSPFITALNRGGDTVPGVRYTTIGSRVDEMIQPRENIVLKGAGATNLVLQDLCADNLTGHFHMVYDPYVQQLMLNTLDPAHARQPTCAPVALGTGIKEVMLAAHS